jgi:hypothetical protein
MSSNLLKQLKDLEQLASKSSELGSLDKVASLAKKAAPLAEEILCLLKKTKQVDVQILEKGKLAPFENK